MKGQKEITSSAINLKYILISIFLLLSLCNTVSANLPMVSRPTDLLNTSAILDANGLMSKIKSFEFSKDIFDERSGKSYSLFKSPAEYSKLGFEYTLTIEHLYYEEPQKIGKYEISKTGILELGNVLETLDSYILQIEEDKINKWLFYFFRVSEGKIILRSNYTEVQYLDPEGNVRLKVDLLSGKVTWFFVSTKEGIEVAEVLYPYFKKIQEEDTYQELIDGGELLKIQYELGDDKLPSIWFYYKRKVLVFRQDSPTFSVIISFNRKEVLEKEKEIILPEQLSKELYNYIISPENISDEIVIKKQNENNDQWSKFIKKYSTTLYITFGVGVVLIIFIWKGYKKTKPIINNN